MKTTKRVVWPLAMIVIGIVLFVIGSRFVTIRAVPPNSTKMDEKGNIAVYVLELKNQSGQFSDGVGYVTDHGRVLANVSVGYDEYLEITRVTNEEIYLLRGNSEIIDKPANFYIISRRHDATRGAVEAVFIDQHYWVTTSDQKLVLTSDNVDSEGNKHQKGLVIDGFVNPEQPNDPTSQTIALPWECDSVSVVSASPDNHHFAVVCVTSVNSRTATGAVYIVDDRDALNVQKVKTLTTANADPQVYFVDTHLTWLTEDHVTIAE